MEDVQEDREREAEGSRAPHQRSNQSPAEVQPHAATRRHLLRALRPRKGSYICAPVAVLWSVGRTNEPLDACGRLLVVCLLWMVVGGCVQALKQRLQPGQHQGEAPKRTQQEVAAESRSNQHSREPPSCGPDHRPPLALALADSLLLCVLQEPLPDAGVPHIQALLRRLESVSHALEEAGAGSEATPTVSLTDKVKLIHTYLRQRTGSLRTVVQVQKDFEARVKDMLDGLDGLWAQLEGLHTGVTISKEASRGHRDLALTQTDAEILFSVLGHYRSKLQSCQANLRHSTQLLQELIWSHTHTSNSVSSSTESLWPELLLQSNIEQFDKVQEHFLSLEQQTSAFRAHLKGLGRGAPEEHTGPHASTNGAHLCSVSLQTSSQPRTCGASWAPGPVGEDADTEAETPLSLCERSVLQFSSTIERLRKSGRRK